MNLFNKKKKKPQSRLNTPAPAGEHYNGPSAAFIRRLHSSDGGDLCGVRGEGSEATQLLKQLLVENGRFRLPADLRGCVGATDRGKGSQRATKYDVTEWTSHAHTHMHTHTHTQTECIMATASTGNFPLAVSADNITQSAPSSTALATSLPSALVGRGWDTILSSI